MATGTFQRTELPGGLRVLTERVPGVRTAALGVWAGVGSRDESPALAGASHYLEHLLFKGTEKRSAADIAAAIDAVGGELNAFTAKEYTCFYARTLDRDLPLAVDMLADMLLRSRFEPDDVDAERQVVLEEIGMHADAPDDVVHDVFAGALFGRHPLGRPVLGTNESITAMRRDSLRRYWRNHYTAPNLVVAAAGNLRHQRVVDLVVDAFGVGDASVHPPRVTKVTTGPRLSGGVQVQRRRTEQSHMILGTGALARSDPRRFALGVLNVVLGGGMSSRLFQEVREKRGLVYSIYSNVGQFREAGTFSVYAGSAPNRARQVLRIVRDEIDRVLQDGLTAEELARGKGQLKGSLVLELEDTSGRMSRLGRSELTSGEILSLDEVVRRVDEVTGDDVDAVAHAVLGRGAWALAGVGPFREPGLERFIR